MSVIDRLNLLGLLGGMGLKSLRAKIFAGVLLCVGLSLSLFGVIAYFGLLRSIEASSQVEQAVLSVAEAVDLLMGENIQFARSIATDPLVIEKAEQAARLAEGLGINRVPSGEEIEQLESRFARTRVLKVDVEANEFLKDKKAIKGVFQRIFFTDRYGLNVGMTSMTEDFVQSDEVWWQRAMESGLYIEDVGFDKPSGVWAIEICVAIPHPITGRPNGVLKVKYNLQDAQDYIARFKQYESGYAYAISRSGRIVLHPDGQWRNQLAPDSLIKLVGSQFEASGRSSKVVARSFEGVNPKRGVKEERIITCGRLGGGVVGRDLGWIFVVDMSRAEVYAPVSRMLATISISGVVLFLVLGGLGFLFASGVSGAVRKLWLATKKVGEGDLSTRVEIETADELSEVASSFNAMVGRLSKAQSSAAQLLATLEEQEANFRDLFDNAPIGYCELDAEGRILRVNKAVVSMLGYSVEKMLGRFIWEFILDGSSSEFQAEDRTYEATFVREDGANVSVLVTLSWGRRGSVGLGVTHCRAALVDIQERQALQQRLSDENDLMMVLLDHLPDSVYFKDSEGRYTKVNRVFLERLGVRAPEQVIGKTDVELRGRERGFRIQAEDRELMRSGRSIEGRIEEEVLPDGRVLSFEVTKRPLRNRQGEVLGVFGVASDITERKLAEAEAERRLSAFREFICVASSGDLTVRGDESPVKRDTLPGLGLAVRAVNAMLDDFCSMFADIRRVSLSVLSGVSRTAKLSEEIAKLAEEQADEITCVSSSIEEMAAQVAQSESRAEEANLAAARARELADRGAQAIQQASAAMVRVESAVSGAQDRIEALVGRSFESLKLIALTREIATKTKLLAFNAAIEAARAGDKGARFSVVANEVRTLAASAAEYGRRTADLIEAMEADMKEALAAICACRAEVVASGKVAALALSELALIPDVVRQVTGLTREISAAQSAQAQSMAAVARRAGRLASMTLAASSASSEAAASSRDLLVASEQMVRSVSRFRIDRGSEGAAPEGGPLLAGRGADGVASGGGFPNRQ
jgi:PAS domain S-box-containing protein